MKEELEKEIKAAIDKNLPNQVGELLKQRLEKAEEDAETVKDQEDTIKYLRRELLEKKEEIKKYEAFDERNSKLEEREKQVSDKERNLEIEKLKYELEAQKGNVEFTKSVALGLVRNIEYRKSINDSYYKAGYNDYNTGKYVEATQENKTHIEDNTAQ